MKRDKNINERGGAIIGSVFLMSALALVSILALLRTTESIKIDHIKAIKKKSFELVVDNLKTKLANPYVCSAALRGRRLTDVLQNIDPLTGMLTVMNTNNSNPFYKGPFVLGQVGGQNNLQNANPTTAAPIGRVLNSVPIINPGTGGKNQVLPALSIIDPILPGFDPTLIKFKQLSFNIENNSPKEIYENIIVATGPGAGTFELTGAGSIVPPNEQIITRYKTNLEIVADIGVFSSNFYISNMRNNKPSALFSTEYVTIGTLVYPRRVYTNGAQVIKQVQTGNPVSGYSFQWTKAQLISMGISMERQELEIPLYIYTDTNGLITDCFMEDSAARSCELNGGIWRTKNPPGYECEPRNKCLTSKAVYAPDDVTAKSLCPVPFDNPLKVGVAMDANGIDSDPNKTSYLCRWCNTNRY